MEIENFQKRPLACAVQFAILLGVVAVLAGCGAKIDTQLASTETPTAPSESAGIRLVNVDEFAQEMEQRKGKVVLLDMWATW